MNKTTSIIASLLIGLLVGGEVVMAYQNNMGMMGHNMSKMNMSAEMNGMMAGLQGKTGDEFDKAFMSEMIVHHQGAIDMANSALVNAKHQEIKDLAKNIISAQTGEIKMMQDWQNKWYLQKESLLSTKIALAAEFETLSKGGNSSCSLAFQNSIDGMPDPAELKGSCCSPMNLDKYTEQVTGLEKYKNIPEIPSNPYDINAGLAKKLKSYYDLTLTQEEQKAYDYAMANSMEKGPCCCKCWRWYVYGGLGKLLIRNYHFTGQQVTEIWNFSDGCGGNQ